MSKRARFGRVRAIGRRWREGLVATAIAVGLWSVAIPGASVGLLTREVPIRVANLPEGYLVEGIDPPRIEVQFEGKRRDLMLAGTEELAVEVDAFLVKLGRRTFEIGKDQVTHPDQLRVVAVRPSKIKLSVETP